MSSWHGFNRLPDTHRFFGRSLRPPPPMANHQQHHHQQNHLLQSHASMSSPPSSSSAAYQHFQPWRNCIKTEKADQDNPGAGDNMFYNSLDLNCGDPRMNNNNMGVNAPHPPFHQPAAYPPVQKLLAHQRDNNPELDLKLQQCIDEGNCVGWVEIELKAPIHIWIWKGLFAALWVTGQLINFHSIVYFTVPDCYIINVMNVHLHYTRK